MFLRCTTCGASNQLAASKLADPLRCGRCRQIVPAPAHALVANTADMQEIMRDAPWPVLVDLWTPNAQDARTAAAELEKLARRHQGHLIVLRINVELLPTSLTEYAVRKLPTYLFFDHGREIRRLVGTQSADQLEFALSAA